MTPYLVRRLLLMVATVFLLSIFVFVMIRQVPGSVVDQRLTQSATPAERQALKTHFGLDKPVYEQYVRWLGQFITGDLGRSWLTNETIVSNIKRRMPVTLELLGLTMLLYLPLGIGMGILSAVRRNKVEDYFIRFLATIFLAVPHFWLATLVIVLPLVWWGYSPPVPYVSLWVNPLRNLQQVAPAAAVSAIAGAAVLARVARSEMLEVVRQDYVRTAYAKGLASRTVIVRHALRNAMTPLITIIGLGFAGGIAGAVITEQIFNIPGMGRYIVGALQTNDLPIVQTWMVIFGSIFVLVNLLVDVSYGWLNPRIRVG